MHISKSELRLQVRLRLGKDPVQEVWELAEPRIEELRNSTNLDRDLTEVVRWMQRAAQLIGRRGTRELRFENDRRGRALAEILALHAAAQDDVRIFRRRYLRSRLIDSNEVADWVQRKERAQGKPTLFMDRVPLDDSGEPVRYPKDSPLWPGQIHRGGGGWEFLEYANKGDDYVRFARVRMDSPLEQLKWIADNLKWNCSWPEAEAVLFVLSGIIPMPSRASATVSPLLPFPARARIRLDASPRLNPSEVAELYRKTRTGELSGDEGEFLRSSGVLPSGRVREMSREHCDIAVFIAKVNDGRKWEEAMEEWNQDYPHRKRSSVADFIRAARQAYHRVTGQALRWQRGRGDRSQKPAPGSVRRPRGPRN